MLFCLCAGITFNSEIFHVRSAEKFTVLFINYGLLYFYSLSYMISFYYWEKITV